MAEVCFLNDSGPPGKVRDRTNNPLSIHFTKYTIYNFRVMIYTTLHNFAPNFGLLKIQRLFSPSELLVYQGLC
jgi:hypothetical protein